MRFEDYTLSELRKLAKLNELRGFSKLRRSELIDLLRSKRNHKRISRDTYKGKRNTFNSFFDRIFIINLTDMKERFERVTKQFHREGIKYTRFNAVDGRCKTPRQCEAKRKDFEDEFNIKISKKINVPTASLVLGTIQILREQVRNKWSRVLIVEDDINFSKDIKERFKRDIKELPARWDLLYLGVGNQAGTDGISTKKSRDTPHKTSLSIVSDEYDWYVRHKDDLRTPCEEEECPAVDPEGIFSYPKSPGGTWGYAISLAGAKKLLKSLKNVNNHIDQLLIKAVHRGEIKALAWNFPLIFHEGGAVRADSVIPWDW